MNRHPDLNIPLAQRVFTTIKAAQLLLVMQFVTEIGTGKNYFRFVSPSGQIEGYAGDAENAYERALEIAARLGVEIHDEVIHVSV